MSAILEKKTEEVTSDEIFKAIEDFMDTNYTRYKDGGVYIFEHYVDYRDEISDSTIKKAIENAEKYRTKGGLPDYRQSLDEVLWDDYTDWDCYEESRLRKEISNYLEELGYQDYEVEVDNFITDQCAWYLPESYLNRDVKVNIMIDTGNWNGDCVADDVLNWDSQYYCPRNRNGKRIIPKESSLLWLAKQQGKKQKLEKAIRMYDEKAEILDEMRNEQLKVRDRVCEMLNALWDKAHNGSKEALELAQRTHKHFHERAKEAESEVEKEFEDRLSKFKIDDKFINSCIQEYENLSSHMGTMTFLVTMPLFDFFELKARVNGERDRRRDDRGFGCSTEKDLEIETADSITIDKSVMCGLFSPWGGGGSVLDVECEKDVKIPLSILFDVSMDGEKTYGYDVNEVYGLVGSAWDAKVTLNFESAN